MPFLYHLVPMNMEGKILYPLNLLREKYPGISELLTEKCAELNSREPHRNKKGAKRCRSQISEAEMV